LLGDCVLIGAARLATRGQLMCPQRAPQPRFDEAIERTPRAHFLQP
jgi:hypothetical protein